MVIQQMGLKVVVVQIMVFIINGFIFKVLAARDVLDEVVSGSLMLSGLRNWVL